MELKENVPEDSKKRVSKINLGKIIIIINKENTTSKIYKHKT